MEGEGSHLPVLLDEVTFLLRPRRGGWVVDGTIGMGGHAERLLEVGGEHTRLLGLDRDPEALRRAGDRLQRFGERVTLRQGSFRDLAAHAQKAGVAEAAAILLDLGLSSYQLAASASSTTSPSTCASILATVVPPPTSWPVSPRPSSRASCSSTERSVTLGASPAASSRGGSGLRS